jgi:hypothetical protein
MMLLSLAPFYFLLLLLLASLACGKLQQFSTGGRSQTTGEELQTYYYRFYGGAIQRKSQRTRRAIQRGQLLANRGQQQVNLGPFLHRVSALFDPGE